MWRNRMIDIKISVVIPVYNAEHKVKKILDSILQQDLKETEIICVDDESQDDSYSVLKKEAEADERIVVLRNEKNEGTLVTRKRGVAAARGEYIMFADNDDRYLPDVFGKLYSEIKEKDADILMYGFRPVEITYQDGEEIITEQYRSFAVPTPEFYEGDNCIHIENRLNLLWNKIIRAEVCKKAYEEIQDVRMTIAEDTYACWLIHYYAKRFAAIEDVCYEWSCADGASTFSDRSYDTFRNLCRCMGNYERCVYEFFISHGEPELAEFFTNGKKDLGYNYVIDKWVRTVPAENAIEGLQSVVDIYGYEKTYDYIHEEWNRRETNKAKEVEWLHSIIDRCNEKISKQKAKNERLKEKNTRLKEKNERLREKNDRLNAKIEGLKQSASYRIGRYVTWLPRKARRYSKGQE